MPTPLPRSLVCSLLAACIGLAPASADSARAETGPLPVPAATRVVVAVPPVGGEVVRIDEIDYPVPRPWAGNRVSVPADTVANLQLIPQELTLNRTKIHLRNEAIEPLRAMAAAAAAAGVSLLIDSGYRSDRYQRIIFRQFMEKGQTFTNIARYVAPPGYSEHALGTVVDFHPSGRGFSASAAYRWLREHANSFGFHETLPRNGRHHFPWEPWHWKFQAVAADSPLRLAPLNIKRRLAKALPDTPAPAVDQRPLQAAAEPARRYQ